MDEYFCRMENFCFIISSILAALQYNKNVEFEIYYIKIEIIDVQFLFDSSIEHIEGKRNLLFKRRKIYWAIYFQVSLLYIRQCIYLIVLILFFLIFVDKLPDKAAKQVRPQGRGIFATP